MKKAKVVFIDRDGVINEYSGTPILSPRGFRLVPGAVRAIRQLTNAGYEAVLYQNTSVRLGCGVGKAVAPDKRKRWRL